MTDHDRETKEIAVSSIHGTSPPCGSCRAHQSAKKIECFYCRQWFCDGYQPSSCAARHFGDHADALRAAREEEREAFLRRACRTGRGWHVLLLEDEINAAAAIRARGG